MKLIHDEEANLKEDKPVQWRELNLVIIRQLFGEVGAFKALGD
jgi:hypothetical protein